MNIPCVSIIISFLNEEKYLADAVESVINQDYENWELILVDDGSSDSSTSMAKEYTNTYPGKIFYAEHENHINKGLSASRNSGIYKSRGEYIAFLDADDVWRPKKLSNQIDLMQKNPDACMLCEASEYWESWNIKGSQDIIKQVGVPEGLYYPPQLSKLLYPLIKGKTSPCPSSIIINRSALERIQGFEESFKGIYTLFEDQAFLFKVYLNMPVFVSSQCNNLYRIRQGSIMHQANTNNNYFQVKYYYLQWAKKYLEKNKSTDQEVFNLLQDALKPFSYYTLRKIFRDLKITLSKKLKHKNFYKKIRVLID